MEKQEQEVRESREEWLRRAIESAPDLSDAVAAKIAALLPPVTEVTDRG